MRLENKVAIVTGGTSGIGAEICREYARQGAKVVVVGRNIERGEKVVAEIKAEGGEGMFVQANVSKEQDVINVVAKAVEAYGKLDVMVNNAGIAPLSKLVDETVEGWDRVMDTNLKSVFLGMKHSIPEITKTKGSVINVASLVSIKPLPDHSAYASSKAAVAMLTKIGALEHAAAGVRCNIISPGIVVTPIIDDIPAEVIEGAAQNIIPMKRLGKTSDIASIAVYLASDESTWTTGCNFVVDGGQTI